MYTDASYCLPRSGEPPSRNQLWFVEMDETAGMRCAEFDALKRPVLTKLIDELHTCNPYAQGYQMMAHHICNRDTAHCKLLLASDVARVLQSHPGVTHRPTASKVAAIFYTEG